MRGTTSSRALEVVAFLRRLTLSVVRRVPLAGTVVEPDGVVAPPVPVEGVVLPEASAKSTGWVSGPADPSRLRLLARWKDLTAAEV